MRTADIEDIRLEIWLRERERGEIRWKTKSGEEIPIKDLSDKHLENILKMVERDAVSDDVYYFDPFHDLD